MAKAIVGRPRAAASFYVYLHRRATDGRVFYVGKGKGNRAERTDSRNAHWRNIVAKHGFIIEFVVVDVQEWYAIEVDREQIAYYGRESLCNMTDGGEGAAGLFVSPETKAKKSEIQRGRLHSAEMRAKIAAGVRRAFAVSPLGPRTDEEKRRISEGVKRTSDKRPPVTAEARVNMSKAAMGKVISPAQREKLSAALKAANGTPERRLEISLRMKAMHAKKREAKMAPQ